MAGPPELAPDNSTDSLVSINNPVNAPVDEAHGLTSDAHRAPAPGTVHSDLDISLLNAVHKNNQDDAKEFLRQGADINVTGEDSLTPLHIASREGFVEVVKLLLHHKELQKPAKFEAATSNFGETALHLASENGHVDVVKVLLDRKTSDNLPTIEARNNYGETALHLASESGHADVVKVLLDRMTLDDPADIEAKNGGGETALHLASKKGNVDIVKVLLDHKTLQEPANIEAATSYFGETALHLASENGLADVVKVLLDRNALQKPANIEAKNESEETPLHLASKRGSVDVVKLLLDRKNLDKPANIETKTESGETALHLASKKGNLDIVKMLLDCKTLENPANIEAKNNLGETALHLASESGHVDVVKVLLNRKTLDNPADIEAKNESGETALHMASRNGRFEVVSVLLDAGARINEKDQFAWTPMHEAANRGKLEVVRLLRDKGADLEGRTITEEKTPLLMAISEQHVRVVDALLESNVAVNTPSNHYTPLTMACQYGPDELVEILLDHGADVTLTDPAEWQPLHVACRYSTAARVKIILERNPPIDVKTDDGWAPLHLAARYGNAEMVGMILKKGPEINTIDPGGWTSLHLAAENENDDPEIVRMLLEKEPDINIVDDDDQTPLHAAARFGNAEVMRTILEKAPDINAVDNDGRTSLHVAARYGGQETVRMILEKDPNINTTDNRGQTPLHLAVRYGNAATVTMILEKRPEINAVDNDGWTALHKVPPCDAVDDRASIAELLIRKGANFLVTKGEDLTPLHVACENGCIDVVEVYLKHANSYDINAREEKGWTALHIAANNGFGKVVELLLRNGVSFDLETEVKKKTPLALSIEHLNAFSAECFEDQQEQQTSEPTSEQSTDRATEESIGEEESQTEQQAEKESLKDCELAIRLLAQKEVDIIPAMASIRDLNSENGLELAIKILTSVDNFGKEADWEQQTRLIWRAMRPKEHESLRSLLETNTPETNTKPETVLQWAAYHGNFSVVWWIFQKTDPPQEDRAKAIKIVKERLNSIDKRKPKELSNINRDGLKEQQAIGQSNKKGQETTKVAEKSKDKSHVSGQVKSKEAPDQHGLSTDEKDRYSHTLDILHDPPLGIGATKEKGECEIPELKDIAREKVTQKRKATIVNFYRHDGRVDLLRRSSDLRDVIYNKEKDGPVSFMERTADVLKSIGLEGRVYEKENLTMRWVHLPANNMEWMEDLVQRLFSEQKKQKSEFATLREFLRGSWQELPSGDSGTKFMKPNFLEKFARKSTPIQSDEHPTAAIEAQKQNENEENSKSNPKVPVPSMTHHTNDDKLKPGPAAEEKIEEDNPTALYIPYVTFETCFKDNEAVLQVNETIIQPGNQEQDSENVDVRVDYKNFMETYNGKGQRPVVQGSRSLDQFYYQALPDIKKRNADQVVTRYLLERKHGSKEDNGDWWPILSVGQLWLWIIDSNTVISCSTLRPDGLDDPVVEGIFEHLRERNKNGGGSMPPSSALDLAKLIVNFCINFTHTTNWSRIVRGVDEDKKYPSKIMQKTVHEGGNRNGKTEESKQDEENKTKEEEKTWKDRFRKSPCEIFAETINGTAVRENTLFTGFVEKVEDKKNGNGIGPKKIKNRDGVGSKDKRNGGSFSKNELEHEDDDSDEKKDWNAIYDAALLLKEVKDIRDELNMIKMVLTQQKLVWEELLGQGGQMSQAMKNSLGTERNLADILKEVVEMDSIAETIQTSVKETLDLEQNGINITEAVLSRDLAKQSARQGTTIMAFTVVTIFFLPMSFLASLFALNVTSFRHDSQGNVQFTPGFIFPVIFCVSIGLGVFIIYVSFNFKLVQDGWKLIQVGSDRIRLHSPDNGDKSKGSAFNKRNKEAVAHSNPILQADPVDTLTQLQDEMLLWRLRNEKKAKIPKPSQ